MAALPRIDWIIEAALAGASALDDPRAKIKAAALLRRFPEAKRAAAIDEICFWCSSATRLPVLLTVLSCHRAVPAPLFWRVLAQQWPGCDATWELQKKLLGLLRRRRPAPALSELPDRMPVYRGCHRRRVRALSWTLDRGIAEGFARGHRGIPVADPVIAEASIDRANVFLYVTARAESEIVLDPAGLTEITLHRANVADEGSDIPSVAVASAGR
jgi:hypothetical protein